MRVVDGPVEAAQICAFPGRTIQDNLPLIRYIGGGLYTSDLDLTVYLTVVKRTSQHSTMLAYAIKYINGGK